MSETVFWEFLWRFMLPSLLLMLGIGIGVIGALAVPISDEDRKKAAKEIEEGASRFVEGAFSPLDGFGSLAWRFAFFYIVGMFSITVLGSMVSDILKLPEIYEGTMRVIALAAEYLPPIVLISFMVYVGQETGKLFGVLFEWSSKLILGIKKMFKLVEKEETEK